MVKQKPRSNHLSHPMDTLEVSHRDSCWSDDITPHVDLIQTYSPELPTVHMSIGLSDVMLITNNRQQEQ